MERDLALDVAPSGGAPTCPYCREPVDAAPTALGETHRCTACEVALHGACSAELGDRCPTPGCGGDLAPPRPPTPTAPTPTAPADVAAAAASATAPTTAPDPDRDTARAPPRLPLPHLTGPRLVLLGVTLAAGAGAWHLRPDYGLGAGVAGSLTVMGVIACVLTAGMLGGGGRPSRFGLVLGAVPATLLASAAFDAWTGPLIGLASLALAWAWAGRVERRAGDRTG